VGSNPTRGTKVNERWEIVIKSRVVQPEGLQTTNLRIGVRIPAGLQICERGERGEKSKKRVWRKGSVAVFQTVGAGSNPATRSELVD
jgi:hypothetical protein